MLLMRLLKLESSTGLPLLSAPVLSSTILLAAVILLLVVAAIVLLLASASVAVVLHHLFAFVVVVRRGRRLVGSPRRAHIEVLASVVAVGLMLLLGMIKRFSLFQKLFLVLELSLIHLWLRSVGRRLRRVLTLLQTSS